jgi:hypothetical protein
MDSAATSSLSSSRARRWLLVVVTLAALGAHPGLAHATGLPGAPEPVTAPAQAVPSATATAAVQAPAAPVQSAASTVTTTAAAATSTATTAVPTVASAATSTAGQAVSTATAAAAPVTTTVATTATAATAPITTSANKAVGAVTGHATQTVGAITSTAAGTVDAVNRAPGKAAAQDRATTPDAAPPTQPTPAARTAARPPQTAKRVHANHRRLVARRPKSFQSDLSSTAAFAMPASSGSHAAASTPRAAAAQNRDGNVPLPGPLGGLLSGNSPPAGTGGAVLVALLLGFVLAAPYAGRWLRPALALGLSPVTLSPDDSPG